MHIFIYSTVYEKKKRICIRIGSVGLYIYFGIKATFKLLKKKEVLQLQPESLPLSMMLQMKLFLQKTRVANHPGPDILVSHCLEPGG